MPVASVSYASAGQVAEARERVIDAACAWAKSDGDSDGGVADAELASAVRALEALTVPKDD